MRFLLLMLITILCGCKNESIDTDSDIEININLDHLTGESLPQLTIESIVHLETNDSSIVGNLNYVEMYNDHVYILDSDMSRAAFAFSKDGAFIKKTPYGKGPGEMINPFAFYIDKGNNLIYIWDQRLISMLQFSTGLEYMGQEVFGNPLSNFAILENDRTLVHTHYTQDFVYKIYSTDNKTVEQEFVPDLKYPGGRGIGRSISVHNRVLATSPYQYNIYELKDNKMSSAYFINFGKYKITESDVEQNGMIGCIDLVSNGKRVSSLNDISVSDSFLSFRVYFESEEFNFVYSFNDEKAYLLNEYFGKNILPVCLLRGITEGDLFYAIVEPADLDNFQKTTGKLLIDSDIDYDGNPYLMTFTLN